MIRIFYRNALVVVASFLSFGTVGNTSESLQQSNSKQDAMASFVSDEPRIVPPSPNYSFPASEILQYGAEWHMFNAGTATIQLQRDGTAEKLTASAGTAASQDAGIVLTGL